MNRWMKMLPLGVLMLTALPLMAAAVSPNERRAEKAAERAAAEKAAADKAAADKIAAERATAAAAAAAASAQDTVRSVAPLAARDTIERLKSIRTDILIENETARLLKARLERMQLEQQINEIEGGAPAPTIKGQAPVGKSSRARVSSAPPAAARASGESDLIVKSVTVRPFKEAIVTYHGRAYTVRPGDQLGPMTIKDVTESGVVTSGEGANRSVMMGR